MTSDLFEADWNHLQEVVSIRFGLVHFSLNSFKHSMGFVRDVTLFNARPNAPD